MPLHKKLEMLGFAHNQGAGAAKRYLRTGKQRTDAFGTKGVAYFKPIRRRLAKITKPGEKVAALQESKLLSNLFKVFDVLEKEIKKDELV